LKPVNAKKVPQTKGFFAWLKAKHKVDGSKPHLETLLFGGWGIYENVALRDRRSDLAIA
jgi:hypothetical protein